MAYWLTWVAILLVAITPLAEAKAKVLDENGDKPSKQDRRALRDAVTPPQSTAPASTPVDSSTPASDPPQDDVMTPAAPEPAPAEPPAQPAPAEPPAPAPSEEVVVDDTASSPKSEPMTVARAQLPWAVTPESDNSAAAAAISTRGNESLLWFILPFAALVSVGAVFVEQVRRKQPPFHAKPGPREPVPAEPGVPAILRLAQQAVARGDLADALKWFDTALLIEPQLAVANFCRGVCLESAGEYEDAHVSLLRALGDNDVDLSARFHLARVAVRTGRNREAMDTLSTLLTRLPEAHTRVASEPVFTRLADHPRFLMLLGRL